uniref:Uncharacterized protein n=1 Tax=Rhizophora mucronata TaxID=61149 RepID=A0A2P2QEG0_RHIMU
MPYATRYKECHTDKSLLQDTKRQVAGTFIISFKARLVRLIEYA